ncbi:hypothetical protein J6590_071863 [Homalodisca vitripennis]|nr:hypothetical protein J6590_071863 [Homalodisca vitripennis]
MLRSAVVALVVVVASVSAAISEIRPRQTKPGRFLSLPVPQKCSQIKATPAIPGRVGWHSFAAELVPREPLLHFNVVGGLESFSGVFLNPFTFLVLSNRTRRVS